MAAEYKSLSGGQNTELTGKSPVRPVSGLDKRLNHAATAVQLTRLAKPQTSDENSQLKLFVFDKQGAKITL
jgi:K+-transporting ATPase c subunit